MRSGVDEPGAGAWRQMLGQIGRRWRRLAETKPLGAAWPGANQRSKSISSLMAFKDFSSSEARGGDGLCWHVTRAGNCGSNAGQPLARTASGGVQCPS